MKWAGFRAKTSVNEGIKQVLQNIREHTAVGHRIQIPAQVLAAAPPALEYNASLY